MRALIENHIEHCVGCNRCTRNCPVECANVAYADEKGEIKVKIDTSKCIACGACLAACQHNARDYVDDTEQFIEDLKSGAAISVFSAPASRTNGIDGRILAWLKGLGVKKIFDVSLGADICTWAHIRFIQKNNPPAVITQPCPAIVNYCLMYRNELLPYLSPVHSPMLCTAVYMKQYAGVQDRIAAISPCIAKAHEFEATNLVQYNVTYKKLLTYIENHNIQLPAQSAGFDHAPGGLGSIYSMPGGLKENVEFFLDKTLRIDKSEGPSVVYHALNEFTSQPPETLPAIFDVLNCVEGCNLGTGCRHEKSIYEINTVMDTARQQCIASRQEIEALYEQFDNTLRLEHFVRRYTPLRVHTREVTDADIERAFADLGKVTPQQKQFDCSACGSDTCLMMARKLVLGVNVPENCVQKNREEIKLEHKYLSDVQARNLQNVAQIHEDIEKIKSFSESIATNITDVNASIVEYSAMAKAIDDIAAHINIISLNASIEAARAGQHGRTFAVVADEIRRLAASSKETVAKTDRISSSANASVKEMNASMDEIYTAVDAAYTNISSIIADSSEKEA